MQRPELQFDAEAVLGLHGIHHLPGALPGKYDLGPSRTLEDEAGGLYFEEMARLAETLPIDSYREKIINTVADNPVTIITAETGAGKSTQVPQFLLPFYETIYLTQPRRVAALSVKQRIADELSQVRYMSPFGGEDLVNCQTAAMLEGPEDARIRLVTDGLQLVRELHGKGTLAGQVLIIDEVHEWNNNIELLVAWSKKQIAENPGFKVVIMSATMDAHHLADYYAKDTDLRPPIIEVPGRNYHTEWIQEPESTAVDEILKVVEDTIDADGSVQDGNNAVLCFVPGKGEIQEVVDKLKAKLTPIQKEKTLIFPLHAKMSPEEQQQAITGYPGYQKIIISTNVASTSITIPDVKTVIDSGEVRRVDVDLEGTPGLPLVASSLAELTQNAGRAGRVSNGRYILTRLNQASEFVSLEDRDEYPPPFIMSSMVDRSQLRLKALGLDLIDFDMYHTPSPELVKLANENLNLLGALDADNNITDLGRKMDGYPLSAPMARAVVESERYNQNIRRFVAAIAASHEAGDLRYFAPNIEKRWEPLIIDSSSDLMAQLDIFMAAQRMTKTSMIAHDLDVNNIVRAQEQFGKVAALAGTSSNRLKLPTENEQEDIKVCLTAGFLPYIYKKIGDAYVHAYRPEMPTPREISKRSVVTGNPPFLQGLPYRVVHRDGEVSHHIEDATPFYPMRLGQVAAAGTVWVTREFTNREGKIFDRQELTLFGRLALGIEREVPPEPSPKLREAIIGFALQSSGYAQAELRKTKKALEELARISKDPLPKISVQFYEALVQEAASLSITNASEIEDNLAVMLRERRLGLDDLVPPERREQIINDAPLRLELGAAVIKLKYSKGQPIARSYRKEDILLLDEEVFLPDGRQVMFARPNDNKKYTLQELKVVLSSGR